MQITAYPALLLNADFRPVSLFPLSIISWQQSVSELVRGRVATVAQYDRVVRSPSQEVRLPSVVALKRFRRMRAGVPFTRYNVFLRDRFTCQYCLAVRPASELTFDHVRPRSMGGGTSWENVVTACGPCNTRKGSSMRMQPRAMPRMPTTRELMRARVAVCRCGICTKAGSTISTGTSSSNSNPRLVRLVLRRLRTRLGSWTSADTAASMPPPRR